MYIREIFVEYKKKQISDVMNHVFILMIHFVYQSMLVISETFYTIFTHICFNGKLLRQKIIIIIK